ncbi:hypothetical protein [Maribacter polysaccharolyticus]|uniref:hypothetical protein n=1 Tax=Maribacter polysaccharolyticus TaxID=3020831 RepID=UPI00237FCE45|nr:hypothetical protein [Maribacter polysaccharolyticus]MDE3741672.1 hypothetical protein [Maribacter polysaccharolyticus]
MSTVSSIDKANKEREKARHAKAKEVVKALTASLPEPDFNPNWDQGPLKNAIAEAAFDSALENSVVFEMVDEHNLKAHYQGGGIKIQLADLEDVAKTLFDWSGVAHRIENPGAATLYHMISLKAMFYKMEKGKQKNSATYLKEMTAKVIEGGLTMEEGASRDEHKEQFVLYLVNVAEELGIQFFRDKKRNLLLNCSDVKFGLKPLGEKEALPYFKDMVENGPMGGRLIGSKAPGQILGMFTAKMPLVK